MFMKATASHHRRTDESKMAEGTSANAVAVDTRNREPAFDDQDDGHRGRAQRGHNERGGGESTEAVAADDVAGVTDDMGDNVGAAVTLPKTPTPMRMLWCTRWKAMTRLGSLIDRATGQIEVGAGMKLGLRDEDHLHGHVQGDRLLWLGQRHHRSHHHGHPNG